MSIPEFRSQVSTRCVWGRNLVFADRRGTSSMFQVRNSCSKLLEFRSKFRSPNFDRKCRPAAYGAESLFLLTGVILRLCFRLGILVRSWPDLGFDLDCDVHLDLGLCFALTLGLDLVLVLSLLWILIFTITSTLFLVQICQSDFLFELLVQISRSNFLFEFVILVSCR